MKKRIHFSLASSIVAFVFFFSQQCFCHAAPALMQQITKPAVVLQEPTPFSCNVVVGDKEAFRRLLGTLESKLNVMIRSSVFSFFRDEVWTPLTKTHSLLKNKVVLVLQNNRLVATRGSLEISNPILEVVQTNFIHNTCWFCKDKIHTTIDSNFSCVKTDGENFLHKHCFMKYLEKSAEKTSPEGKITLESATEIIPFLRLDKNLYQVLGIGTAASMEEITNAHKKILSTTAGTGATDVASKQQADLWLVDYALKVLSNATSRKNYDLLCNVRKTGPVLELAFNANERIALESSFNTITNAIATVYGYGEKIPMMKVAIQEGIRQLEATAKTHGFQFYLDEVINPCKKLPTSSWEKEMKLKAATFDFSKKMKFLCALASVLTEDTAPTGNKTQSNAVLLLIGEGQQKNS